jgi:glycine/D-amino acid oxidase-like deaminating enzyme
VPSGSDATLNKLDCSHILLAAGPWTPSVFGSLFPRAKERCQVSISPLAGWSITLELPPLPAGAALPSGSDGVFMSDVQGGFSPEFFTRLLSRPEGSSESTPDRWEIWFGGLNSSTEPLPDAISSKSVPSVTEAQIQNLMSVVMRIFTYAAPQDGGVIQGPQVTNTALCFRPATRTGRPIIARIPDELYSQHKSRLAGNETGDGGLFICSGHGPWGIALSLGSGKVMSQIMLHGDRDKEWAALGMA